HTPAYEGLHALVKEVHRFNDEATPETLSIVFDFSPKNAGRPANHDLPVLRLSSLYSVAHALGEYHRFVEGFDPVSRGTTVFTPIPSAVFSYRRHVREG